jgi:hypothetical protein
MFQFGKQRCDRFNTNPSCELDFVKEDDYIGSGYNNYYLGLIYISNKDLKNKAKFGQYIEWMEILLKFMESDTENYDDNFQSAAYKVMATYDFVQSFYDLRSTNGTYYYDAHEIIMNTSFRGFKRYNPDVFPAYGSQTCPLQYKTMLKDSFYDMCGDIKCKMMMMTYRNPADAFSSLLGNTIGSGTSRFKAGKKTSYYDQIYRPVPFKKIREAPPQQLVENVLTCRPNPNTIFINSIGITYSNSQLLLGIVFSIVAAFVVRLWNSTTSKHKIYSVTKKNYVYKQSISAALKCIDDRMKYLEEKCGDENSEMYSKLYSDILDAIDSVDQVDDIDPHTLISLIKAMKISLPIVKHQQVKREAREKRKSIKEEKKRSMKGERNKNKSFFSIAPAPQEINRDDNVNDNGNSNHNDKAIEMVRPRDDDVDDIIDADDHYDVDIASDDENDQNDR